MRSQFRFTSVAPQMCLGSLNKTRACHGQVCGVDTRPPTTRLRLEWRPNLLPQASKHKVVSNSAFLVTSAEKLKLLKNSQLLVVMEVVSSSFSNELLEIYSVAANFMFDTQLHFVSAWIVSSNLDSQLLNWSWRKMDLKSLYLYWIPLSIFKQV